MAQHIQPVFAESPIMSVIPDIPYYYANVPGISFIVDLLLLCLAFAQLMKYGAKTAKMPERLGAVIGFVLGATLAFAIHTAGYRLLQHWLTGLIVAVVSGTTAYAYTKEHWSQGWAILLGVLIGLFVLGITASPFYDEKMAAIISLLVLLGVFGLLTGFFTGLMQERHEQAATAGQQPGTTQPAQGPTPAPGPAPAPAPALTPTPPSRPPGRVTVPKPTPIPHHPNTAKYHPDPPKNAYRPKDPASPRQPREQLLPAQPALPKDKITFVDLSEGFLAVKNQLDTHACGPFACCAILEYHEAIRSGRQNIENDFSELFLWYNARTNKQQNSGCYPHLLVSEIINNGTCKEPLWTFEPASTGKFTQKPPQNAYDDALNQRASREYVVADDADQWAQALLNGEPLLTGIRLPSDFVSVRSKLYKGPIERFAGGDGHAIVIVGYHSHYPVDKNTYVPAFKIRNSWGTGWGENGYVWIPATLLFSILHSPARVLMGYPGEPGPQRPSQGPRPEPTPSPIDVTRVQQDPLVRNLGELVALLQQDVDLLKEGADARSKLEEARNAKNEELANALEKQGDDVDAKWLRTIGQENELVKQMERQHTRILMLTAEDDSIKHLPEDLKKRKLSHGEHLKDVLDDVKRKNAKDPQQALLAEAIEASEGAARFARIVYDETIKLFAEIFQ